MTYSQDCFNLAASFEGCKLEAYQDQGGVWTIGRGHTGPEVVEGLVWTQAQADLQFAADLETAAGHVQSLVKVPLTQGQFDALTDFVYNLGAGTLQRSTLLSLLNQKQYAAIPFQIERFEYVGHVKVPGLERRREAEVALWNK